MLWMTSAIAGPSSAVAMSFTRDEELHLVTIVQSYPCLYDQSHPNYKDAFLRDSLWREIALKFDGKTDDDCKKRWRTIRDTYRRRHKKTGQQNQENGSKKRLWHLASYLGFLENCNDEVRPAAVASYDEGAEGCDGGLQGESEEITVEYPNSPTPPSLSNENDVDGAEFPPSPSTASQSAVEDRTTRTNKRKRTHREGEVDELVRSLRKERKRLIDGLRLPAEDDIDLFYKSVAASVKQLPPHLAAQAKLVHLQALNDLQMQQIFKQESND
ncbi:hypothetical protein LSTR_LSTR000045 [Laodelphax striatellus]|uniref:MADF domain-containing protein n=1 Tax=Laodelphax striatellus TaxID=195883 RepID=A0A482X7P9_LAOST|nr:hypothetical protein LSTR_LSTR000045 [Laodelphax striatellus]